MRKTEIKHCLVRYTNKKKMLIRMCRIFGKEDGMPIIPVASYSSGCALT
jgi:hypothetical protein